MATTCAFDLEQPYISFIILPPFFQAIFWICFLLPPLCRCPFLSEAWDHLILRLHRGTLVCTAMEIPHYLDQNLTTVYQEMFSMWDDVLFILCGKIWKKEGTRRRMIRPKNCDFEHPEEFGTTTASWGGKSVIKLSNLPSQTSSLWGATWGSLFTYLRAIGVHVKSPNESLNCICSLRRKKRASVISLNLFGEKFLRQSKQTRTNNSGFYCIQNSNVQASCTAERVLQTFLLPSLFLPPSSLPRLTLSVSLMFLEGEAGTPAFCSFLKRNSEEVRGWL